MLFFKPEKVADVGIEPILRGFTAHPHQQVDVRIIDDVRNFLFVDDQPTGTPRLRGFDLASLNIHRGRDHGLPSYNDMREALGLKRKESFSDMTEDPEVQRRLREAYGTKEDGTDNTDNMDIWVAGLPKTVTANPCSANSSTRSLLANSGCCATATVSGISAACH